MQRRINIAAAIGFAAGVALVLLQLSVSHTYVVARWTQPAAVNYQSFDPYTLFVLEHERGLLWITRDHEARIVRGKDESGYGHYVQLDLSFLGRATPIDKSTVTWSAEGVTLSVASGHRYFFPKAAFVGGR